VDVAVWVVFVDLALRLARGLAACNVVFILVIDGVSLILVSILSLLLPCIGDCVGEFRLDCIIMMPVLLLFLFQFSVYRQIG
jgi:hypothetical protein